MALLWVTALMIAPLAHAQSLTVSGTVYDNTGEVMIGATVSVKGKQTIGTATDIDGKYTLSGVPSDGTLVFSFVGFQAVEEPVKGRTVINATLREDAELLDEVVVVGYGSLSRREVSSSIVQVNKSDFQQGAMNNPMEMLTDTASPLAVQISLPAYGYAILGN